MVTDPLFGGKGTPNDPGVLRAGNFYVAIEGEAFRRIVAPWCLSYHPASPPPPRTYSRSRNARRD
jgi:hypothetical protein